MVEGCENVKEREDVSTLKLFRKTGNEMGGRSRKRVKGGRGGAPSRKWGIVEVQKVMGDWRGRGRLALF